MPPQKPGRSRQDYGTPPEFLDAVRRLLLIDDFVFDLAADPTNAIVSAYYTATDNALVMPWTFDGWCWLNPPFGRLKPWAEKAWLEAQNGAKIAMLVPAAVGANWFRDWVWTKASVRFLNGRLTFVGEKHPYIKDLMLLCYDETASTKPIGIWSWQTWLDEQR